MFPCVGVCGYPVRTECGHVCGGQDLQTHFFWSLTRVPTSSDSPISTTGAESRDGDKFNQTPYGRCAAFCIFQGVHFLITNIIILLFPRLSLIGARGLASRHSRAPHLMGVTANPTASPRRTSLIYASPLQRPSASAPAHEQGRELAGLVGVQVQLELVEALRLGRRYVPPHAVVQRLALLEHVEADLRRIRRARPS